jgi:hypothetical protein
MGIAGRVRPCRRSRSGSPHAPWKAGGRSGTKRTLHLFTPNQKRSGCNSPHVQASDFFSKSTVQCSEGYPTPMGIAGRVRPCRRSQSGSPHAPWKAGGRSGTKRTLHLFTPNQKRSRLNSPHVQASISKSTQCRVAMASTPYLFREGDDPDIIQVHPPHRPALQTGLVLDVSLCLPPLFV